MSNWNTITCTSTEQSCSWIESIFCVGLDRLDRVRFDWAGLLIFFGPVRLVKYIKSRMLYYFVLGNFGAFKLMRDYLKVLY